MKSKKLKLNIRIEEYQREYLERLAKQNETNISIELRKILKRVINGE